MTIEKIPYPFSVCKVTDYSKVDFTDDFVFIGKTDEEHSLVCRTEKVPDNTLVQEDGWRGLRIGGVLDFSLIGILAKITSLLAANKISVFAVSTYNTDYIFVKNENYLKAIALLNTIQ